MLPAALRRGGAAWLAHLGPAAGRSHLLGNGLGCAIGGGAQRALAAAASSPTARAGAAAEAAAVQVAAPAGGPPAQLGPPVMVVESPAKARKIQGFLGEDYLVLASYGHVRDLPARKGSVDPDAGFSMQWEVLGAAEERLPGIAAAAARAPALLLASDPDREGEAIAWHLLQELRRRGALREGAAAARVTFTEVTRAAVLDALQRPRDIAQPLVDAYMARRALDYLFGFHLSPLLWRKVPGARSAGRVQSVALRLVCEREAAVEAHQQRTYFSVGAQLALPGGGAVQARLAAVDGAPPPQPGFEDEAAAAAVAARVAAARFAVAQSAVREQQRQPPPPFTTSTLQQEANKRLGLGASRTMALAQALYEGGHISYMRTDGAALSPAAVDALRAAAAAEHGAASVAPAPRVFKARGRNAQEAHEAIRPTDPAASAEALVAQGVDRAAARLYGLIRGRAMACQMAPARIALASVELASEGDDLRLRASASSVASPGFLAAYFDPGALADPAAAAAEADGDGQAGEAEAASDGEGEQEVGAGAAGKQRAQEAAARAAAVAALGALRRGDGVTLRGAAAAEHETRPPARFTEGTLVRRLEELGIGRPSTYAPTLAVLQSRGYVRREGRALHAEPLGRILSAFLAAHFPRYVDYGFTSGMEERLDEVSAGATEWRDVLGGFWGPFAQLLSEVAEVPVTQVIDQLNAAVGDQLIGAGAGRACPSCGGPLSLKFSSRLSAPPFVGCSKYPECTFSRPIKDWQQGGAEGEHAEAVAAEERAAQALEVPGYARLLGTDPDTGLPVLMRLGLYGPYVQRGTDEGQPGFRRQALPKRAQQGGVTLGVALQMLALPKDLGASPATGEPVLVSMGKFGPFIRCGALSRSIPKEYDPLSLTLSDALQLLAAKSNYATSRSGRKAAVAAAVAGAGAAAATAPPGGAAAPRRRGRPRKLSSLELVGAAEEAAQGGGGGAPPPPRHGSEAQQASAARVQARAALDAAAELEAERLKAALAVEGVGVRPAKRPAPSGYALFLRSLSEEARRTGDKWWRREGKTLTRAAGERWAALPPAERQRFNQRSADLRTGVESQAHEFEQLSAQQQPGLAEKRGAAAEESAPSDNRKPTLPRPRTAYNLFTSSHLPEVRAELGPRALGRDIMLRLTELWRSASPAEKARFRRLADEETALYREAKAALSQAQQAATSAALAAGADDVAAARAGMLAGQAVADEYVERRRRHLAERAAGEAAAAAAQAAAQQAAA